MKIVPAHSVPPEAIAACLDQVAQRDLMVLPICVENVLRTDAVVASDAGTVIGVGWRNSDDHGATIDVRVRPGCRRRGVGTALFERLADIQGALTMSCDAGHQRAGQFALHRGFEPIGFVFHQRWDGTVDDAPRAFRTAELREETDHVAALALLREATAGSWPRPSIVLDDLRAQTMTARSAFIDGQRVGVIAASRQEDAFSVAGFAVLPAFRNRGVGRSMLCELMRQAANADLGVVLRVSHADERLRAWTASFGFWTYRTWAHYRRVNLATAASGA